MSVSGAGARRPGPRRFAQSGERELRNPSEPFDGDAAGEQRDPT
jgi:hypothetical protein